MCSTFTIITSLLFSAAEPADSHSNKRSMSLVVRILLQSLDAAMETYGMRHVISHGTPELITQLIPAKIQSVRRCCELIKA